MARLNANSYWCYKKRKSDKREKHNRNVECKKYEYDHSQQSESTARWNIVGYEK